MVNPLSISALVSRAARAGAAGGAGLCVLQGRYGRPMACLSRFLGHWPKDGPAALADGRRSQALRKSVLYHPCRPRAWRMAAAFKAVARPVPRAVLRLLSLAAVALAARASQPRGQSTFSHGLGLRHATAFKGEAAASRPVDVQLRWWLIPGLHGASGPDSNDGGWEAGS